MRRALPLLFPSETAHRHAVNSGELHDVWHRQSLLYAHLPLNDALPGSRSFRVGRLPLVRQQQQQCCCYLIYNLPVLWRSGAAARWSRLHTPVETLTPPRRRGEIRSVPFPPHSEFSKQGFTGSLESSSEPGVSPGYTQLRTGAPSRTRTGDPLIKSQLLYQLS